ncbi:MAG: PASTA domain-containing protein [Leptospirales bacterium]|nr:PASTA domain-containing protein [Leptospirales bacterium]
MERENRPDEPRLKYFGPISKIALIMFLLFSLFLFISTIMIIIRTKPAKSVKMPDLVGQRFSDVSNGLIRDGLKPEIRFRETFNVENGVVLKQYPESGAVIPEGNAVKLTVSRNGYMFEVPDLAGKSLPVAKNSLRNLHYHGRNFNIATGVVSYVPSEKIPENTVIAQSPKPGERISPDYRINLLVSAGTEADERRMPDVMNQSIDLAYDLLAAKKVNVTQEIVETWDKSLNGFVIGQSQPPQSPLANNASVRLKVALYPVKGHPYYAYEKIQYTIPASYSDGRFEAYVEDDGQKRICFSENMKGGQQINFVFHRIGKAKITITRDKETMTVMGINVEDY